MQEWVDHRSTERFYANIRAIGESGVLRARGETIRQVAIWSSVLILYNVIAGGWVDFDMVSCSSHTVHHRCPPSPEKRTATACLALV